MASDSPARIHPKGAAPGPAATFDEIMDDLDRRAMFRFSQGRERE